MRTTINCKGCGESTWYNGTYDSVSYVDACRRLDSECKCGEKNE